MPRFVIERNLPGAGQLSDDDLRGISQKSCSILRELGAEIRWIQSYVTDDRIYCIYESSSTDLIREHAARGGFPADRISEIRNVIDPSTAD